MPQLESRVREKRANGSEGGETHPEYYHLAIHKFCCSYRMLMRHLSDPRKALPLTSELIIIQKTKADF